MEGVATPGNTMGMGNPMPPMDGEVGSEPICTAKCKKEKKKKIKESLLDDEEVMKKGEGLIELQKFARWIYDHQNSKAPRKSVEYIEKHLSYADPKKPEDGFVWNDDFDTSADEYLDLVIVDNKLPYKFDSICGSAKFTFTGPDVVIDLGNFPMYMHGGSRGYLHIIAKKATEFKNMDNLPIVAQHMIIEAPCLKEMNYPMHYDVYSFDIRKCTKLEKINNLPVITGKERKLILPQAFVDKVLKMYMGPKVHNSVKIIVK
jgi:hypothetical protein